MDLILDRLEGFEWDEGNEQKSLLKHGVTRWEAEETFFNFNLLIPDFAHSQGEPRYHLLGETNSGRILLVVFTVRRSKIRVISSRLANKKERAIYAK
jgi:uncharacterized DUF497 family protein